MDKRESNLKLNDEIIITENISPRNSFTASRTDESRDSDKCGLKHSKIDESRFPVELHGKLWLLTKTIGEGTNFKTYHAIGSNGKIFAVRINRKQDPSTEIYETDEKAQKEIANSIKLQADLDLEMNKLIGEHPNIVSLIGFRQMGLCWLQYMEYVSGGSLFDYLNDNYIEKNQLLEVEKAQSFFSDLLNAVKHIHSLRIAHMDIKLENCLITEDGTVKLTDFDEARYFIPNLKVPYPTYFTLSYAAPETFAKLYRPDCADIWACGIFLYFLLQKRFPWNVANSKKDAIYRKWSRIHDESVFSTLPECYGCVSGKLTAFFSDLLMKILKVKVKDRATLEEIQMHAWLQDKRNY
uniref:Protein kinase domain-containing protein n=1 Tax=Elaeophora elaphi TaxID=1147741 RepID=A0A0R3RZX9_9BILA